MKLALNDDFHTDEYERAKRMLENLARSLEEHYPGQPRRCAKDSRIY